ncbi:hypothetical protein [Halotalea alkalilenta]|uniref:Uncharacterized protein n=1 Tax=Halotalea alkalilenta TaxID=376489 RepID=A0A172YI78_9GAMM|nr:hypothetical protein [Halotalea alkalilenta]ANF58735.1 hypothetical protein A5892_15710 [Halotalea alkalilenta]
MKIVEHGTSRLRSSGPRPATGELDEAALRLRGSEFVKAVERSRSHRAGSRSLRERIEGPGWPELDQAWGPSQGIELLRHVVDQVLPRFTDLDGETLALAQGVIEEEIEQRLQWLARQQEEVS